MTYAAMFKAPYVRGSAPRGACSPIAASARQAPQPSVGASPIDGLVIHFVIEFSGFRGRCLEIEPVLFDAASTNRLPVPYQDELDYVVDTDLHDSDIAAGWMWVNRSALQSARFIVRVEVYDAETNLRLTFYDSAPFCSATLLACSATAQSPSEPTDSGG